MSTPPLAEAMNDTARVARSTRIDRYSSCWMSFASDTSTTSTGRPRQPVAPGEWGGVLSRSAAGKERGAGYTRGSLPRAIAPWRALPHPVSTVPAEAPEERPSADRTVSVDAMTRRELYVFDLYRVFEAVALTAVCFTPLALHVIGGGDPTVARVLALGYLFGAAALY